MTSPSDYAVHGPDRPLEVPELAPVAHQDRRLPRRSPNGGRRRKRRAEPDETDAATPPDEAPADQTPTASTGDDGRHVVDTLA